MGIYCEINLYKPENGAFIGMTGTVVSGVIKYALDEETVFNNITVSLIGMGTLCVEKNNKERRKYYNRETYIDIDNVIRNDKEINLPIGSYETPFKFEIPRNVPPTLSYRNLKLDYKVACNIIYYVRIKFNRPGLMNFAKRFKKEITMISCITPRLPITPVIYGRQKKLSQLFTRNPSTVNIKANVLNCVIKTGDKIELIYEVINDTNLVIKAVEIKLVEVYKFYVNGREITRAENDVPETDSKIGAIQSGLTREMSVEINVPSDRESAEFSKLYSKDYFVFITIHLPIPHRNYKLEIPIQIGNVSVNNIIDTTRSSLEVEDPPSYWEAMNEYLTDKSDVNEK